MDILSYIIGRKQGENSSGGGSDINLSDYFASTIDYTGFAKMIKKIPDTTIVQGTDLHNAFEHFQGTEIPLLDTSSVTNMRSMFNECPNLITIPLLDTSSVTDMSSMLANCSSLKSIPLIDTSSVTGANVNYMFYNCTLLETIPVLNLSKVTNMNNMFTGCTHLSDLSLDNILQMCINSNVTTTSRKKLTAIGLLEENYPTTKLERLAHYPSFIEAGWITGY